MSDNFTMYQVSILYHSGPSCIYVRNVKENSWSSKPWRCHLYCVEPGDTEEGKEQMEALLATLTMDTVELHGRGAPYVLDGGLEESFPVDLLLCSPNSFNPFLPGEKVKNSLIKLLNLVKFEDDESIEDEKTIDESLDLSREFDYVIPAECSDYFHWLDPEIPGCTEFEARATHVDSAGQIYLQLHSQRETVRILRRLLDEKCTGTNMDCDRNSFRSGQECCVRWKDGNWYRGRFLRYSTTEDGEIDTEICHVLLVDYGNLYVASVMDVRSAIYGERIPVQAIRTVIHNILPANDEGWNESFLDWLMETVNYAKPGYNDVLRVEIVGDSVSQPLPVVIHIRERCTRCRRKLRVSCDRCSYLDLAREVLTSPGLKGLDTVLSEDMAAIYHPQLETARRNFSYINAVAPGTYGSEKGVHELLLPPVVSPRPPQYFQPIFPSLDWNVMDIKSGMTVPVESISKIIIFDRVFLQLDGDLGSPMYDMRQNYNLLMEQYQEQCENNPPVVRPIIGMPVAVKDSESAMWCRAEIVDTQELETRVRYVDYGYLETVKDSRCLRQLPEAMGFVTTMAVELELGVTPIMENKDILDALMVESILSFPENCLVCVKEVSGPGKMRGQLVSMDMEPIYKGLVKEGVIQLI